MRRDVTKTGHAAQMRATSVGIYRGVPAPVLETVNRMNRRATSNAIAIIPVSVLETVVKMCAMHVGDSRIAGIIRGKARELFQPPEASFPSEAARNW